MAHETVKPHASVRREAGLVFLTAMVLYAVTSPGNLIGDSAVRWNTASRFVHSGWFDLPPGSSPWLAIGKDGRSYPVWGIGQPACLIPFVILGQGISSLPLPVQAPSDMVGQFLASVIFFPACGALAVLLIYLIALEAMGSIRLARWAAVLAGAGTMLWQYSINTYEESQTAVCLLLAVWAIQRYWIADRWRWLVLAMMAMGVALVFRVSAVVLILPVGLVGVGWDMAKHRAQAGGRLIRWVVAAIAGLLPFVLLVGAYNFVRFGSPLETGLVAAHLAVDNIHLFETPLLEGLGGLLVSPGKSVFLYNPVLLLSILGLRRFWKRSPGLTLMVVLTFACTVLFHSRLTFWTGDLAWGPRYLGSVMGLSILPALALMEGSTWAGWKRKAILGVVTLSVVIQMASVTYNFGLEFFQDRRHGSIPDAWVWDIRQSQLVMRFRNIALDLTGRPDYSSIPPLHVRPETYQTLTTRDQVRPMHAVHFFPFKALAVTGNRRLFHMLLAVWLAGLLAIGGLCWVWYRRTRPLAQQKPDADALD